MIKSHRAAPKQRTPISQDQLICVHATLCYYEIQDSIANEGRDNWNSIIEKHMSDLIKDINKTKP